jgi:alginate O-acetyltransferase complex protein AlgI
LAGALDLGLRLLRIALTWAIVHTAWVYFRAADFGTANALVAHMWLDPLRGAAGGASILLDSPQLLFLLPVALAHAAQCGHEWLGVKKTGSMRVALAGIYLAALLLVDRGEGSPFLYFQF